MSTSNGDDPDSFKGPGGLSARQIFEAVQHSVEKDTYQYGDEYGESINPSPPHNQYQRKETQQDAFVKKPVGIEPETMNVKELRELLTKHSIDYSDCFEKNDLVERVKLHIAKINKE